MKWNIISDSSIDKVNFDIENTQIKFSTVPFTILIDGVTFVDDENLDKQALLAAMESGKDLKSACPAPSTYEDLFEEDAYNLVYTISSNLSGSFNSAVSAKEMFLDEHPNAKIEILNSYSAGAELAMCVDHTIEEIKNGKSFEEVVESATAYFKKTQTCFSLCSFGNLVRNGRMGKLTFVLAKALHMWGIGVASPVGTIEVVGKTKGAKKVILEVLKIMKENNFNGKKMYVSHCENPEIAELLIEKVKEAYPGVVCESFPTKGVCSFYAEREGFIVGY